MRGIIHGGRWPELEGTPRFGEVRPSRLACVCKDDEDDQAVTKAGSIEHGAGRSDGIVRRPEMAVRVSPCTPQRKGGRE